MEMSVSKKSKCSPEESAELAEMVNSFFRKVATPPQIAKIYGITDASPYGYVLDHPEVAMHYGVSVFILWSVAERIWGLRPDRFTVIYNFDDSGDSVKYIGYLYEVKPGTDIVVEEIGLFHSLGDIVNELTERGMQSRFAPMVPFIYDGDDNEEKDPFTTQEAKRTRITN